MSPLPYTLCVMLYFYFGDYNVIVQFSSSLSFFQCIYIYIYFLNIICSVCIMLPVCIFSGLNGIGQSVGVLFLGEVISPPQNLTSTFLSFPQFFGQGFSLVNLPKHISKSLLVLSLFSSCQSVNFNVFMDSTSPERLPRCGSSYIF